MTPAPNVNGVVLAVVDVAPELKVNGVEDIAVVVTTFPPKENAGLEFVVEEPNGPEPDPVFESDEPNVNPPVEA